MPDLAALNGAQLPRQVADSYLDAVVSLDPIMGTLLGVPDSARLLPDFSPDGQRALAHQAHEALRRLAVAQTRPGAESAPERHCARLLHERLTAGLALEEAGEGYRTATKLRSPVRAVWEVFTVMPSETEADWESIALRMRAVPDSLDSYRASLTEGIRRGLPGQPAQVVALLAQLQQWIGSGQGWFGELANSGPAVLRGELEQAAGLATGALLKLHDWLRDSYAPAINGASDIVGRERYGRLARYFTGADVDLDEAYAYGWSEFHRLLVEMRREARKVLPGVTNPWEALSWLDAHGEAVEGVEQTREWLQSLMDETIEVLDGTHFDLAERVKRVEVRIAPSGAAAYYTPPSLDFSRPGRTWLPTMGRTRFPVHSLVSTWYHEGVPGHHLQLAQMAHVAKNHSRYQATLGMISANAEGWALYAERLMDELGYLTEPQRRLGYLDSQMLRAMRVIVDIGMHLELTIPADSPFRPGERWTPGIAVEFLSLHSGQTEIFCEEEILRYQGMAGQAIGYKLGERAWLRGREAARKRQGKNFKLRQWHMAALSQASLGLDDLLAELSEL